MSQWKVGVGNKVKVAMPTASLSHYLVVHFLTYCYVLCVFTCVWHTVEVIGQLLGVSSLLPSHGSVLVAGNQTRVLGLVAGALTC